MRISIITTLLCLLVVGISAVDNFAGNCLDFDGIDNHVLLDPMTIGGAFTIESYIFLNAAVNFERIIDFGNGSPGDNIMFGMYHNTGQMYLCVYVGGSYSLMITDDVLPTNQWVHLAATVTDAGVGKIYWDGVLKATDNAMLVPSTVNRTLNYIGRSNWAPDGYLNAKLDEVRLWNIARTQTEIQNNLYSTLLGTETGLAGYWQFNESSGTIVYDAVGSTTGTLVNMTDADWVVSDLPFELPAVTTTIATSVTETTASSGGNVTLEGQAPVTARGVCWSTSPNPTTTDSYTADGSGTGVFASDITGLSSSATYYYRAYATNSFGTYYGEEYLFTAIDSGTPTVTTSVAASVTQISAATGGDVTSNGGEPVTDRGVCWSTSPTPTLVDSYTTDGTGTGIFASAITGLTYSTFYYYRAYATNSIGTSYGDEYTFTTLNLELPAVTTTVAGSITETTASSGGDVTFDGGDTVTSRGVCYSTSPNPTISDSYTTDGSGTGSFTSSITALTPSTEYFYKAYAINSVGTGYGSEYSFGTSTLSIMPSGNGTSGDPYLISNISELLWISENDTSWSSYFSQTADIDAAETQNWNSGAGFSPIGNETTFFSGSYNGSGYIISNLYINRLTINGVGFIRINSGEVYDLGIENADVTGNNFVGGLVAYNYQNSTITNCYSNGSVSGYNYVGGLVGYNDDNSNITNSHSTGSMSGNDFVGGLVGWSISNSSISNSYSIGSVTGNNLVGGLVGFNYNYSAITNCYSNGSVSGYNNVGGLAGKNESNSPITNSYSTGNVTGTGENVGGLVGVNSGAPITNSYSTGSVNGNNYVGGLVGNSYYYSTITNSYSNGSVSGNTFVGGLVGDNYYYSNIFNSFWDVQTSGQATSAGGTGKTTGEMQIQTTFTDAGWDFAYEIVNGTDDIWILMSGENNDYPILTWQMDVTANFAATPTECNVGTEIQFSDESFGFPTQWQWDFDNDGVYDSTEQNPTYSYPASGVYSVKLTVSDGTITDSDIKENYIVVSCDLADFIAESIEIFIDSPVQFTSLSDLSTTSWQWDFENDGIYDSTEQNPIFTYTSAGLYSVKLTAGNVFCSDTYIIEDYIHVNSEPAVPQNVEVMLFGEDAHIVWDEVWEDADGIPIELDGYIIKFSEDAESYFFLHFVYGNEYVHEYVVAHSPQMFYQVLAYKSYSPRQAAYLQELNNSKSEVNWKAVQAELNRIEHSQHKSKKK